MSDYGSSKSSLVLTTSSVRDSINLSAPVVTAEPSVDPFIALFSQKLSAAGISKEEEAKLLSMRHYIKSASRAIYAYGCSVI